MNIACSKCKQLKALSAFSYRNKANNIRHVQCKDCIRINTKKHYVENKEQYKERAKSWVENNKDKRVSVYRNSYATLKGYRVCECCEPSEIRTFLAECPEGCEVDHIKTIRQQGKHCLKNMRYLEISTHARKSQWERYNT